MIFLYLLGVGVPLYGQLPSYYSDTSDSLAYQLPAQRRPPEDLRYFRDIESRYDTADFDYSDVQGQQGAFLEGLGKILDRIIKEIEEFFYGKNRNGDGVEHLLQMLGVLFLLVVIFFIVRWAMNNRERWLLARTKEKMTAIPIEAVEQHLHQVGFPSLIQKAEAQEDTRQSIRLYYLWLLKVLSDKGKIVWEKRKTNADYQREIDPKVKDQFVYLSKVYNYIWYGEFAITDTQYQEAKTDYQGYINAQKTK